MSQKERITELNKFFSKVSYDYYNIPMAILLCLYKNKFKPMTYNEILKDITSRKDSKKKLRKSTGEEYTGLELAIKNLLNNRKKIFKKTFDEEDEEPKYSVILECAQQIWEVNSMTMSKLKQSDINKAQNKLNSKSLFDNDIDKFTTNELLSRKTRRKNFVSDEESSLAAFSIYHPKGYKSNYKSNKKKGSHSVSSNSLDNDNALYEEEENTRSRSMDKIDKNGYQSDDLNKNKNRFVNNGKGNDNNINITLKNMLFKNNIYDKIPNTDESSLNNIIDKFAKLSQKIKEIQTDLKSLALSKMFQRFFNDNKKKEEKQKLIINNYYEDIYSLIENNKYNPDTFKGQNDFLKRSMNTFLDIYENSYENLFRVLFEKNNIIDTMLSKKEENIQKDLTECINSLNKFITMNKKQINDSFHFLSVYTRNYYLKRFENIMSKIEDKHRDNMREIENAKLIREKLILNKSTNKSGKNVKFFNVQKVNNGAMNKNEIINQKECILDNNNIINNINNTTIINNNNKVRKNVNNLFSTKLIDYSEYNRDAPPAGNINNNNQIMPNLDILYKVEDKDDYNDINSNDNNDSNDNCFLSENSKNENKNENELDGENEKFEIDSNNNMPNPSPAFYNNEYSLGSI